MPTEARDRRPLLHSRSFTLIHSLIHVSYRNLVDALAAAALALLLPSFLGVSRAFVSGLPLSWYGSVVEACLIYIPAALAGVLMPLKSMTKREADAATQAMGLGTPCLSRARNSTLASFTLNNPNSHSRSFY